MKKVLALLVGVLLLVGLAGPARADFTKNKVAVLDFQLQGEGFETKDMGTIVAEWFITALVKTGRFDVVERGMIKKILDEQKMSLTGVIDEKTATKLGKILGVKVIISGSIMKLQDILEVNARIIDVETASIIAAENVKATASTSLQSLIVQMSEKIVKNFPLEGYVVARSDDAVTIDLGKLAGVNPDMDFMVFKEGKVIRHPKTGQILDIEKIQTGIIKINRITDRIATGRVVDEDPANAIAVGQMVKSTSGPLTPLEVPPATVAAVPPSAVKAGRAAAPAAPAAPVVTTAPTSTSVLLAKIQSANYEDKEFAAKRIVREGIKDPAVLDALEKELLVIFNQNPRDKAKCDSIAWMIKALGVSASPQYKPTIMKIAKEADNKAVRGWAKKTLAGR